MDTLQSGNNTPATKWGISLIAFVIGLVTLCALVLYLFSYAHVANMSPPPGWVLLTWSLIIYFLFTLPGAFLCGSRWPGTPKQIALISTIPHLIAVVAVAPIPVGAIIPITTFVIYYRVARRFRERQLA